GTPTCTISLSPACSALSASTPVAYGRATVTSSPCFSKKPRSSAIGRPTWSMPVTMPAFSFTRFCAAAPSGKASAASTSNGANKLALFIGVSCWVSSFNGQGVHALDPVGPGHRVQVGDLDATQLDRSVLRARHAAELLERQHVKALGRARERDQHV